MPQLYSMQSTKEIVLDILQELINIDPLATHCLFNNSLKFNNVLIDNMFVLNYILSSDLIIDWNDVTIIDNKKSCDTKVFTADEIISISLVRLSELFKIDPNGFHTIWLLNVSCIDELLEHPLICVEVSPVLPEYNTRIGIKTLLNSLSFKLGASKHLCLNWDTESDSPKLLGVTTFTSQG